MGVYISISKEDVSEWLSTNFSINEDFKLSPVKQGIQNTNYFVETKDQKYVLTIFEKLTIDKVKKYVKLMEYLDAMEFPIPLPIRPNNERGFYWKSEKPVLLVPFVKGTVKPRISTYECEKIAEMTANMHVLTQNYKTNIESVKSAKTREATSKKVFSYLSSNKRKIIEKAIATDFEFENSDLPRGICHIDIYEEHILWENERINAVIDFYLAGNYPFIYDIALCAITWCLSGNGNSSNKIDDNLLFTLLKKYNEIRPLTKTEKMQFANAMHSVALEHLMFILGWSIYPPEGEILLVKSNSHYEEIYMKTLDCMPKIKEIAQDVR